MSQRCSRHLSNGCVRVRVWSASWMQTAGLPPLVSGLDPRSRQHRWVSNREGMISSDMKWSTKPNVGLDVIHWKEEKHPPYHRKRRAKSRLVYTAWAHHWCWTGQAASADGGRRNRNTEWVDDAYSIKISRSCCRCLSSIPLWNAHLPKRAGRGKLYNSSLCSVVSN